MRGRQPRWEGFESAWWTSRKGVPQAEGSEQPRGPAADDGRPIEQQRVGEGGVQLQASNPDARAGGEGEEVRAAVYLAAGLGPGDQHVEPPRDGAPDDQPREGA